MSFEDVIITIVITLSVLFLLFIFVVLPMIMSYQEGSKYLCTLLGHKPYDDKGVKVPDPRGMFADIAATFTNKVSCKRCEHNLFWISSHGIWRVQ